MSSYFDNQYEGDDGDNKFDGDGSETTNSSESEIENETIDEDDNDIIIGEADDDENDVIIGERDDDDDDAEADIDAEDADEEDEQSGGAVDDELEGEIDEEAEEKEKKGKRTKKIPAKTVYKKPEFIDNEDEEDDEDGEMYLQKFDQSINENYIVNYHPESILLNYDEILAMIKVVRDKDGIIIDDLHRTIPFITKYERSRVLGQRAKQINSGSSPFVKVPENVIDGYIIAELELKAKKIPFIIRRPLPNGGSEYWSIRDLEDITF